MKVEVSYKEQTTFDGVTAFQKGTKLFNKERIGQFIPPVWRRAVEAEDVQAVLR